MKCEACGKPATAKDPVHVVASSAEDGNSYLLICDSCIQDPNFWIPIDWNKVVDNVGQVWWERG